MVLSISLENNNLEAIVIVGGGVAGLSCLNALLDRGIPALLLEGSKVGMPKMCGEFIAPEVVAALEKWEINSIQKIREASFNAKNKSFHLVFPKLAGGFSRSEVELHLAERAKKMKGRIREDFQIVKIVPATHNTPYIFTSQTGEEIIVKTAIFATGKFAQTILAPIKKKYAGIKFHFENIIAPETLLMFSLPNAYLGIVPISETMSNCACLMKSNGVDLKNQFYGMVAQHKQLRTIFAEKKCNAVSWLEGQAPNFELKKLPDWPHAFWIGDALASLHPAIGSGFAHGVSSAILAAELYCLNQPNVYLKLSNQNAKIKYHIGKMMHLLLQYPRVGDFAIPLAQSQPWILNVLLHKIGYT